MFFSILGNSDLFVVFIKFYVLYFVDFNRFGFCIRLLICINDFYIGLSGCLIVLVDVFVFF